MKKYNALFLFLLIANSIFADVILNTSNANPSLYDIITLQAIFHNEDKDGYKIEGLNNFDVLGKGSNSSYSMINGKVTSEKSDTYRIKAKKTGVFTLTLISKKGNSKSINIDVSNNQNQKEIINNKFSLQVNKLKKDYYFGEKIPFEENFITTVQLSGFKQTLRGNFSDFSVKDLTTYQNNSYIQTPFVYKGRDGIKLSLFKGILQANSSGKKVIEGSQVQVSENNGNYYGDESIIGPKKINIDILPLPENEPKDFKDIVGNIRYKDNWNIGTPTVGEAITLNITLSGKGNLEMLNTLPIENNDQFNIFQNTKEYTENINNGQYFNQKTYELAIIPKEKGELTIPNIKIPYFNIKNKKYEYLTILGKKIDVKENKSLVKKDYVAKQSPIQNNIEKSKKIKTNEININQLKIEKIPAKNNYKLLSLLLGIVSILELGYIVYIKLKGHKKS